MTTLGRFFLGAFVMACCSIGFGQETAVSESVTSSEPKITYREDVLYGRVQGAGLLADIASPESGKPLPAIISVPSSRLPKW